ncbi:hypothetical protein Q9L58_005254 [Maublancomyces gigas]|uniref:Cytochrome P450 n=1 Tax=Discina gigas TaxID=1032678 RepID=A0ABR3GIT0_9PEZI
MGILIAIAIGVGTYIFCVIASLANNVHIARRSGLPVLVQPMHCTNPLYMATMVFWRPIIQRLPFGLSQWKYLHFFYMDWAFHTRDAQFEEYGDMFIIATPGGNILFVGDAGVFGTSPWNRAFELDLVQRGFVSSATRLSLYTEGSKWRQHRKITSPPFSEAVNSAVWKTTLSQATYLLAAWTSTPASSSQPVIRGIRTVARNVLSSAGFGVDIPFAPSSSENPSQTDENDTRFGAIAPADHVLPYGEALDWLIANFITLLLVPPWMQRRGPAAWRTTAAAYADTRSYISELLERERQRLLGSSSLGTKKNLLGALVATSDGAAKHEQLSQTELVGNVFVFAVAGLETTAGTMQYALTQLALRRDLQEWMWTDLDVALKGMSEDPTEWDYSVVWPKLIAPLCIIHETLRLFPTFQSLPKWTSSSPQTVTYKSSPITIPPATSVFLTLSSLHSKRKYWGPQATLFRPQAWDVRIPDSGWSTNPPAGLGAAPFCHLRQPPVQGCYIPFAEGFRQCLGKNFALVEMAAIMTVLFRAHSCRVARRDGETQEDADARARNSVAESVSQLSIMMKEDIELVWERR